MLFRRSLSQYDEAAAQRALDDLFKAFTIDAVLRDAILPFLREIGESWEAGVTTAGQEHFASTIIQARLLRLSEGWGTGTGPRALLACPSDEGHTLGLVAFGIVLSRRGWRITYLGADTPAASLAHAADLIEPAAIVLAAARRRGFSSEAGELEAIAKEHPLCIAGAGASERLADRLGAGHLSADPVTAASEIATQKQNRPAWRAG
jgi:methanogenic corrinoid protein MtbC1